MKMYYVCNDNGILDMVTDGQVAETIRDLKEKQNSGEYLKFKVLPIDILGEMTCGDNEIHTIMLNNIPHKTVVNNLELFKEMAKIHIGQSNEYRQYKTRYDVTTLHITDCSCVKCRARDIKSGLIKQSLEV